MLRVWVLYFLDYILGQGYLFTSVTMGNYGKSSGISGPENRDEKVEVFLHNKPQGKGFLDKISPNKLLTSTYPFLSCTQLKIIVTHYILFQWSYKAGRADIFIILISLKQNWVT
jgi:hypothetical protein